MLQKGFRSGIGAVLFRGSQQIAAQRFGALLSGFDALSGGKGVATLLGVYFALFWPLGLPLAPCGWPPLHSSLFLFGGFNGTTSAYLGALLGYPTMLILCLALATWCFGATDRIFCGSRKAKKQKLAPKIKPDGSSKSFVYAPRLFSHA